MISRNILQKAVVLIAVGLLAGCSLGRGPPAVSEIQVVVVQPGTTIQMAGTVTLQTGDTATLHITAPGSDLKFEWTVDRGTLSDSTRSSVLYTAPNSPGPDLVTVKVSTKAGEVIKSISFNVVEPLPPTATDTPVPQDTPTPTPVLEPIACDLPPVTKNLFPQQAEETGQFPMYGPVGDPTDTNFLCEGVYDIVHNQPMAVHIKYENVGTNFGWWGVVTPNGYDASQHSQLCFWAYAQEPNQSFRLKMKDTTKKEQGVVTTIEVANQWTHICTDISTFKELGIQVDKMDNVNLGFEKPTGSAEIWIADFEFASFIPTNTFTPEMTGVSTAMIGTETSTPTITSTPIIHAQTPNATQILQAAFDEVDRQFQDIKSNIAYNAPETMKLDDTVTIELLLNPSFSQSQLATQAIQRGEQSGEYVTSTSEPGQPITLQGEEVIIVTSEIQITDRMKAVLTSKDPDAFIIQASHDNADQPISRINTTIWRWNATAKKRGIQTLELVIYRLIKKEGSDYWREVESYRREIIVEITLPQWIEETLGLDWRWLLTTLLIPLFFWWINNRRKKAEGQKASLQQRKRYKS